MPIRIVNDQPFRQGRFILWVDEPQEMGPPILMSPERATYLWEQVCLHHLLIAAPPVLNDR
ncbi:hypothetical protein D6833_08550 [Candidatus Parcubacteria bacterium]|nr:MAG: hypothetical protein D6833_08550 [Candidatus Parcubacteria bacterium]